MSFAAVRSGEPIPTYNGKDYPYWKDKMMRNMIAINPAGWEIVKDGVVIKEKKAITADELKCMALDAEVRVFITNHISAEKYLEVRNIASAKGVWDYLEKIGEGASTQKDARIDTLQSKFYRFARKDGERVEATYNRLTTLSNELVALGAPDITDHLVVRQLLRSLDESFEHLVMMIKERSNYKDMTPADILERLMTYELELEEKRDVNGTRRRSHALKAKASRHSSPEPSSASSVESDDPSGIGKDLALIVKRFNRFQRRSSSSPKKSYSSRHSSSSSHRSSSRSSPAKDNCCYVTAHEQ
jgi:gag-polypeptide of LTR copia-type